MNFSDNQINSDDARLRGGSHRTTCQIALLAILLLSGLVDAAVIALAAGVADTGEVFAFVAAFVMMAVWTLLSCYLMESLGSKRSVEVRMFPVRLSS